MFGNMFLGGENMEKEIKTKQLLCKVPEDIHLAFKIKTLEKGTTMAEVINKAIKQYLEK